MRNSYLQLIFIVIFSTTIAPISTLANSVDKDNREKIFVNGVNLDYQVSGNGPPVLLVHGHISDRRVWSSVIGLLENDFRVFAYSQRYYGSEPWLDDGTNFTRENHIRDLIKFVESINVGPVHLVTRSYGGYVGAHAIQRRPELFLSATHFEPAITDHIKNVPGYKNAWNNFINQMGPVSKALTESDTGSAALRFLEVVYKMPENTAEHVLNENFLSMIRHNGRAVGPYFKMETIEPLTCSDMQDVSLPHLIVEGENTHVWFSMAAEQMHRCLSSSTIKTMEAVNHNGIARKPEEFVNLVRNFISSL